MYTRMLQQSDTGGDAGINRGFSPPPHPHRPYDRLWKPDRGTMHACGKFLQIQCIAPLSHRFRVLADVIRSVHRRHPQLVIAASIILVFTIAGIGVAASGSHGNHHHHLPTTTSTEGEEDAEGVLAVASVADGTSKKKNPARFRWNDAGHEFSMETARNRALFYFTENSTDPCIHCSDLRLNLSCIMWNPDITGSAATTTWINPRFENDASKTCVEEEEEGEDEECVRIIHDTGTTTSRIAEIRGTALECVRKYEKWMIE